MDQDGQKKKKKKVFVIFYLLLVFDNFLYFLIVLPSVLVCAMLKNMPGPNNILFYLFLFFMKKKTSWTEKQSHLSLKSDSIIHTSLVCF